MLLTKANLSSEHILTPPPHSDLPRFTSTPCLNTPGIPKLAKLCTRFRVQRVYTCIKTPTHRCCLFLSGEGQVLQTIDAPSLLDSFSAMHGIDKICTCLCICYSHHRYLQTTIMLWYSFCLGWMAPLNRNETTNRRRLAHMQSPLRVGRTTKRGSICTARLSSTKI